MARAFSDEVAAAGASAAALADGAGREGAASRQIGEDVFGRFARLAAARR
jgi:hypothetical protein